MLSEEEKSFLPSIAPLCVFVISITPVADLILKVSFLKDVIPFSCISDLGYVFLIEGGKKMLYSCVGSPNFLLIWESADFGLLTKNFFLKHLVYAKSCKTTAKHYVKRIGFS